MSLLLTICFVSALLVLVAGGLIVETDLASDPKGTGTAKSQARPGGLTRPLPGQKKKEQHENLSR